MIPYVSEEPNLASLPGATLWQEFIAGADASGFKFERFPFNHPLYILYSSGTTGVPKCIVHGAGGTLIQHLKEHQLHCDIETRRSRLLLHDLRLDDVELAGDGAGVGSDDPALRRRRRSTRTGTCSSISRTRPA